MKRALKKRVKAVLKNTPSSDATPIETLSMVSAKTHRRVTTQAAMIGLAISMGATSLLVTRQSDQAQAAAPVGSQKAASTISAASDTEMKFVPTKLETKLVSSATIPENPVIVEPTAISQLPGLEAKLQVAASGMSVPVPAPENIASTAVDQNSINQPPQLAKDKQALQQTLNAGTQTALGADQLPTTVNENTVNSEDVNAQLKAQQEFALYRLQEKSNRLRASLAELRSGESKNSAKTIASAQQTTAKETLPQTSAEQATPQLPALVDEDKTKFFPEAKQTKSPSEQAQPVATTSNLGTPQIKAPVDTDTAYEVKPGDTLAAIANRYNTTVAELAKLNNISNPNQLRISQKLILPAAKTNGNAGIPIPVVMNPAVAQSNNNFKVASVPVSTASTEPNLSLAPVSPNPTTTPNPQKIDIVTPSASADAYGVGGDTPVPKVFAELQPAKQIAQNAALNRDNARLRSLQAEIQKLQQKYRAQESGSVVAATPTPAIENNRAAIPIPVASPSNLSVTKPVSGTKDFAVPIPVPTPVLPSYTAQPVKPEFRATRTTDEPINPEFLPNQAARTFSPYQNTSGSRVATPPIGVNAADSLGRMRGTKVSPQLPPLAAVEQYLPKPVDEAVPPPSSSSVAYIWPAKGVFTSGYGWRWGRMHKGIDVANATGTPVYASADGVIEKAGWNKGGYGNLVDIRHPDGSMTRYGHNSKILVRVGQQVRQGETIALMGSTGFSTGPHSHFEIHPSGKGAVNPIAFLPQQNRI
ncbi:peptidoglycan DD-metalloendopeptidase family protein [Nostoc sp. FACHB-110]|uniref:peptidoglycan DD-metalloendopeptidase family protein n=1 Tax=Nostoc sp. FACHB-110 TaxID=2692834 RepID=UPI001689937B|nr:peptidoglycan DD-metalloendopeptidase family protein [Nostoc sp. FACHB-110]MBD2437278.1 peptidoglycan DD-metalloendopeptidase family protein [Nostoc sp. FACHB-110]